MESQGLIKRRELAFSELHADPNQAETASNVLVELPGVAEVKSLSPTFIEVEYDLRYITLREIEEALLSIGLHLDGRLYLKLKRALYYYTEDTQRANMGCQPGDTDCTRKVFASQYKRRDHGCRDDRPSHWRKYL